MTYFFFKFNMYLVVFAMSDVRIFSFYILRIRVSKICIQIHNDTDRFKLMMNLPKQVP